MYLVPRKSWLLFVHFSCTCLYNILFWLENVVLVVSDCGLLLSTEIILLHFASISFSFQVCTCCIYFCASLDYCLCIFLAIPCMMFYFILLVNSFAWFLVDVLIVLLLTCRLQEITWFWLTNKDHLVPKASAQGQWTQRIVAWSSFV